MKYTDWNGNLQKFVNTEVIAKPLGAPRASAAFTGLLLFNPDIS